MGRQMLMAVAAALVVGGAFILLGPHRPAVVPAEFPRYTAEEKAAGLDRVIAEVRFDNMPMEKAFAELARLAGTTVEVKWKGRPGLTPDMPVTLHLHNIELSRALEMVYGDLAGGQTWQVQKGKIQIPQGGVETLVSRIYDVEDLVEEWIAFDSQDDLREAAGERLWVMLTACTGSAGGSPSIEYWSGHILAIQTPANHKKIQEVLALLRTHAPLPPRPQADPLAKMVPPAHFDHKPLREVLAELEKASGVDFVVAWRTPEGADMNLNKTIDLQTQQSESLEQVLTVMREQMNHGGITTITCRAEDGRILVGGDEMATPHVVVRIYDIRDLIDEMMRFSAHFPAPGGTGASAALFPSMGARGGGGGSRLGTGVFAMGPTVAAPMSALEAGDDLGELVERWLPDNWMGNGGGKFAWHFAGRLVIGAGPEEHEQVKQLLALLRAEMKRAQAVKETP